MIARWSTPVRTRRRSGMCWGRFFIGAGGVLAVCAYQRATRGRSQSGVAGNEEGGQRGFGAAWLVGDEGGGKHGVAEEAAEGQLRAAAGRGVGVGCGYDGEAVVWTPGRCEGGIQSAKARASLARLSQLLHREPTDGDGRGSTSRESDGGIVCAAGVVVIVGRNVADESSEISAWGLQLGKRAGDGRI